MLIEEQLPLRPQLIGHEWAAGLLQTSIDNNKLSHAYIFSGPNGIGKSFLAHQFAMALCCQNPPSATPETIHQLRFCGECQACRLIREDHYPDVTVVGLEWQAREMDVSGTANSTLKIDTVRAIQHEINTRPPREAPKHIFIVEDAVTMQPAAANAFLKTLEEPPARTLLILISDSDRTLLPTIVSRCQVFELRSVPKETLQTALTHEGASPEQASLLAALAVGRPGYALRLLHDRTHQHMDDRDEALMHHHELLTSDKTLRLNFAEELNGRWQGQGERRAGVITMLNAWLGWWRDLALVLNGQTQFVTNQDRLDELQRQAAHLNMEQIKAMLRALTRTQSELDSNVSPRLAFGDLFINTLPYFKTL